MSKDNNKTKKSQYDFQKSNTPSDEFLEYYTKNNYWDEHKKQSETLSNLYNNSGKNHLYRYGERTKTCSEFLTYANRLDFNTGELTKKLVNAQFCRVRLCPVCMWRRSLMWQARFYEAIPALRNKYPRYRFLFLTLTVKNCAVSDLSKTLKLMNDSFRKMLKYKSFGFIEGWLKTTEITRNSKTGEAHPHFHILIMTKPNYFYKTNNQYLSADNYMLLWQKALKVDYLPVIDIRTVKNKYRSKKNLNENLETPTKLDKLDLTGAIQETLKYSVKMSELFSDPAFLYVLTDEISHKRFISSGGLLKNILQSEQEISPDELLNDEQLDAIEQEENNDGALVFKYSRDFYKYKKYKEYKNVSLRDQDTRRSLHEKARLKQKKQQQQKEQEALQQQIKQLNEDAINSITVVDLEKDGGEIWKAL